MVQLSGCSTPSIPKATAARSSRIRIVGQSFTTIDDITRFTNASDYKSELFKQVFVPPKSFVVLNPPSQDFMDGNFGTTSRFGGAKYPAHVSLEQYRAMLAWQAERVPDCRRELTEFERSAAETNSGAERR